MLSVNHHLLELILLLQPYDKTCTFRYLKGASKSDRFRDIPGFWFYPLSAPVKTNQMFYWLLIKFSVDQFLSLTYTWFLKPKKLNFSELKGTSRISLKFASKYIFMVFECEKSDNFRFKPEVRQRISELIRQSYWDCLLTPFFT